mmetsp:Transcript_31213/g.99591  ORF Transcript_31213/g.99591 Transcript_31213/m.99591 type:complete len:217 (+) Transcript_31213:420-1070(+)
MLSFMRVPPRSLAPAESSSCAIFRPSLTQLTCTLRMPPGSRGFRTNRATACARSTSMPVGPARTRGPPGPGDLNIGASAATKPKGTNSVKPAPEQAWACFCSSRSSTRCCARCCGPSQKPNIIVEVVGRPKECAVVTTSTHCATLSRPRATLRRSSSSRTSALVPGRLPTPAARSSCRNSRTETRERAAPYSTSSGEKACMCKDGCSALMARQIWA